MVEMKTKVVKLNYNPRAFIGKVFTISGRLSDLPLINNAVQFMLKNQKKLEETWPELKRSVFKDEHALKVFVDMRKNAQKTLMKALIDFQNNEKIKGNDKN